MDRTGAARPRSWQHIAGGIVALCLALGVETAAGAEDWQIGHGPFLSASDVRSHSRMPLDILDVMSALSQDRPDWSGALERFAFGKHFSEHSLAIFTDNYNNRFPAHLPVSTVHFGTPGFQNYRLLAALAGTGAFRRVDDSVRIGFIEAGLLAVVINWARYELGESRRKAHLDAPNWSLENGSPKNWNEIFAFYWGPEGRHSVYEALAGIDGGDVVNERLVQALADGQEVLVTKRWSEAQAMEVEALLDEASLVLLRNALEQAAAASLEEQPGARARIAGYWLAAAEAVASDSAVAERMEAVLHGEPESEDFRTVLEMLAP